MRNTPGVRWAVAALAVAGCAAAPAAAAAADSCGNAAFRAGAGSALPDCRAWEQVSPVEKNGVDVVNSSTIASVAGGDGVYFNASGAFPGAAAVLYDTAYAATRGAGWSTRGLDPQLQPSDFYTKATLGLSEDNTKAVVSSSKALTPGAVEGGSNLYLRHLTQPSAYRLVATADDGQRMHRTFTGFGGQGNYVGGNADLSAFTFRSPTALLPGAPGGVDETGTPRFGLYLWHDGRLSLAGVREDGAPITFGFGDSNTPARFQQFVSDDGTRVWFKTSQPEGALYAYEEGKGSTLVSRRDDDPDTPVTAGSVLGSADGRALTFSAEPLTDEPSGIYRWSAANPDELTPVGPADAGASLIRQSPDGRTVWFTSTAALTDDAGDSPDARLYQLDAATNEIHYVTTFSGPDFGGTSFYRFSPDRRRVAFQAFAPLTGVDNANPACVEPGQPGGNGFCGQIYTWDADAPDAPLQCASCGPEGTEQTGTATFGRVSTSFDGRESRAVLDDGTVFFDSPHRLASGDTNRATDVYQWRPGGELRLLSGGTSALPANFGDVSENGRDVFFATGDQLVPQDTDAIADLYTARAGGGIAAQQVAPVAAGDGCSGESCRPGGAAQPARPVQGSASFAEPEPGVVPTFRVTKPSRRALRTAGRRGRLTLWVGINVPGSLSATLQSKAGGRKLRTVGRVVRKATQAGTVRLTVRLSKAARRQLRRTGKLSARLTVAYSERTTRYRTTLTFTTGRTGSGKKGGAR